MAVRKARETRAQGAAEKLREANPEVRGSQTGRGTLPVRVATEPEGQSRSGDSREEVAVFPATRATVPVADAGDVSSRESLAEIMAMLGTLSQQITELKGELKGDIATVVKVVDRHESVLNKKTPDSASSSCSKVKGVAKNPKPGSIDEAASSQRLLFNTGVSVLWDAFEREGLYG